MSTPVSKFPTIFIQDSLSGDLKPFIPQAAPKVSMYVCGVTVYDFCHIGHARAYVIFDCIRRTLTHAGYDVTYVQNFTDIDDKIIARANEKNISTAELTTTYIQEFFKDMDALGIERASRYPKATDYVEKMQDLIQKLIENGAAYVRDGDVFYAIDAAENYGKLSKKIIEDLVAGKRVNPLEKKKNPLDFSLWKASKPNEPAWESPWGPGRPGWHIECSAMALETLGETLDIHGGGEDLIFPHHENEICQSESVTHKPLANYWIHNGFVTIKNEKMSKSQKNFFTIREILDQFPGETLRFFLLKVHYRSPLSFSFDGLKEADQALKKLKNTLSQFENSPELEISEEIKRLEAKFNTAIFNDFNFAEAIGVLFELHHHIHLTGAGHQTLRRCGSILGLFPETAQETPSSEVIELGRQRQLAKQAKEFAKADQIRNEILNTHGWIIEDTKEGIRWKKA